MKPFKAKYRRLVRALTVGFGVSTLGAAASSSLAQVGPDPGSAGPERIIITGSTIPTAGEITESPVTTLDQREIQRSGTQDILSVLQKREPALATGNGNLGQTNANIASGNTLGGSTVAIHNLSTLVLFNGRRIADSAALSVGGSQFKDVNLFPVGIINRIEILKDGASTIYGSDAIGGVVNIISTTDFNGALFSGRYGVTEKSDVSDKRYSLLTGFANDKGTSFVFGAQYTEQDPLYSRDRTFTKGTYGTPTYAGVVRSGGQYFLLNQNPNISTPSGLNPTGPNAVATTIQGNGTAANPGLAAGTYAGPFVAGATVPSTVNGTTSGFDLNTGTTITLDQRRYNFYASANQELYGKYLQFFGDFLYADNYSQSQLNAQPISTAIGAVIPQGSPFNVFNRTIDSSSIALSVPLANRLQVNDRFVANPRIYRTDSNFYRILGGLHGDIIPNVLSYEAAFNFSKYAINFKNYNLLLAQGLNQAIAGGYDSAGNPVAGGAFSQVNVGGTPTIQPALDFFARSPNPASLPGVFGTDIRDLESNQRLTDGKLVYFAPKLPSVLGGGQIGMSIGGEYREEFLRANVDPQLFLNFTPAGDIRVHRNVRSVFTEVRIPLITPEAKIPGVYSFDLDASGRYEDYSDAGDSEIPKVGFVYRPIADVAIRGTYSKSFIAPNLYQTGGPQNSGATTPVNFGQGQGAEQGNSVGGSNPFLSPSTSNNFTGGITLTPKAVPGLTISADYFYVYQTDIVGTLPTDLVAIDVNNRGPASQYAGLVHFGSITGPGVTAPGQLSGNFTNYFVNTNLINAGGQRVQGMDFLANYTHDFGKIGQFSLGALATLYIQYEYAPFLGAQFTNQIGKITSTNGTLPQYTIIPTFTYSNFGLTYDATARYFPGVRNFNTAAGDPVRDYFTFDMRLSYEFKAKPRESVVASKDAKDYKAGGKNVAQMPSIFTKPWYDGITLTFGVNNVGNRQPPFIGGGATDNTDTSTYDPYGRTYYFEASKRF